MGAVGREPPHRELSLTEWVVLALLVEGPAHGFALAKHLQPDADLGRVVSVHRPLVYRALDRLVAAGLAESHHTEPGRAGPRRAVHGATTEGRDALDGCSIDRSTTCETSVWSSSSNSGSTSARVATRRPGPITAGGAGTGLRPADG